ncbi:hypothetical protein C0995_006572 [Termitomyces sp. Mi166|nr:hypothetical protein C0995_006572 [Termitomyces sp. Mi166\
MTTPHLLRARLLQDLRELKDSPYPGVAVFTDDADIRKLCLVLTPPSGPWKGLSLHFDVDLPNNWVQRCRNTTPQFDWSIHMLRSVKEPRSITGRIHGRVEQDYGAPVCIGDYIVHQYMTEEHLTNTLLESWHRVSRPEQITMEQQMTMEQQWAASTLAEIDIHDPVAHCAKTIEGGTRIHRLSAVNPRWKATYDVISQWQCKKCPYGSESLPAHRQVQEKSEREDQVAANLVPPPMCLLGILNDDILLELSTYMLSESVVDFSVAYPRFHSLITRPHFERARKDIWVHLQYLDEAVRKAESAVAQRMAQRTGSKMSRRLTAPPSRKAHQVVEVVYRMVNNIVVSLMKSCDHVLDAPALRFGHRSPTLLHASEKAVVSYCHLFHLLLSLTRTTPAILHDATRRLRRFIMVPESRSKTEVPDLGELIVLINLVLACPPIDKAIPLTWQLLNGPFLEEAITRNVRWMLADNPELEVLEEGASDYRLQKTFLKSRTSLRLIMFQIAFLDIFIKAYAGPGVERLDENYGFPEADIPERMAKEVKAIYEVATWPGFFERVQYARGLAFDKEKMSELLRAAVSKSTQKRYHTASLPGKLHILARERDLIEKEWIEARKA